MNQLLNGFFLYLFSKEAVPLTFQQIFAKAICLVIVGFISGCSTTTKTPIFQSGMASWYGKKFHGRKTASGETYNMNDMTAAHKTLAFGTKVKVVEKISGKSVVVRINDRGPFIKGRIIDLSKKAAEQLGIIQTGKTYVSIYLLGTTIP